MIFDKTIDSLEHFEVIPSVILGDVDGNGKVNNRDLGLMQRVLNESNLSGQPFDRSAADLDGNGKLNNRDLGLLQRQLNR